MTDNVAKSMLPFAPACRQAGSERGEQGRTGIALKKVDTLMIYIAYDRPS